MKRIILAITIMAVWVNGMFAQTDREFSVSADSAEVVDDTPKADPYRQKPEIDYQELVRAFHQYAADAQNEGTDSAVFAPVQHFRKDWLSRHANAFQRLEISIVGGTDGDPEDTSSLKSNYNSDEEEQEAIDGKGQFNHGLSAGYTYGLVFGRTDENNKFTPNKFGFSLNTGFIFAYDRQKRYGTTFDLLGKIGFEAGYHHTLGIEIDFLLGSGKSCGDFVFFAEDENGINEDRRIPFTDWCLKYGGQISLRSNLLHTQIKNTDIRLFVRYVYSKNPINETVLITNDLTCIWQEESWSFGLTFGYNF